MEKLRDGLRAKGLGKEELVSDQVRGARGGWSGLGQSWMFWKPSRAEYGHRKMVTFSSKRRDAGTGDWRVWRTVQGRGDEALQRGFKGTVELSGKGGS